MATEALFRVAGERDRSAIGGIITQAYLREFRLLTRDAAVAASLLAGGIVPERFHVLEEAGIVVACLGLSDVEGRAFAVEPQRFRELTGRIKGTIAAWVFELSLARPRPLPTDMGFIEYVTVTASRRGAGLGRQLMTETLALPRYRRFQLTVLTDNKPAQRLYRSLGFNVVRRLRHGLFDPFPLRQEYVMEYERTGEAACGKANTRVPDSTLV